MFLNNAHLYSIDDAIQTIMLHGSRCWGTAEFSIKEMFNMPKTFTCDVVIDTNHLSHITNTVEIQV